MCGNGEKMLKKYVIIFLVSMVPLIELRGAVPIAVGMNLPLLPSYIICILGNMLPVPFIFFFARKVLEWGADKPVIGKFFTFCLEKGHKGGRKLQERQAEGFLWHYYSSWVFRCPEPERGQEPLQPAFWIWILSPA